MGYVWRMVHVTPEGPFRRLENYSVHTQPTTANKGHLQQTLGNYSFYSLSYSDREKYREPMCLDKNTGTMVRLSLGPRGTDWERKASQLLPGTACNVSEAQSSVAEAPGEKLLQVAISQRFAVGRTLLVSSTTGASMCG